MKKKVIIFCGGRGSASLIKYFSNQSNIELTLLINAFDDGKSTGKLRKYIPGLLGPSDFRKNFSYLINFLSDEQRYLKKIFEYRVKRGIKIKKFYDELIKIQNDKSFKSNFIPQEINLLEDELRGQIFFYSKICLNYLFHTKLDLYDFSFGNIVFVGIFLHHKNNFNQTVKIFSQFINSDVKVINISNNKDRWLLSINKNNKIILDESKLVNFKQIVPIKDLFLLKKEDAIYFQKNLINSDKKKQIKFLKQKNSVPEINPEAKKSIIQSDYIIYGPGTQHSSLFPSYIISNSVIKKSLAKKIFIMNLDLDNDIAGLKSQQILKQALRYLKSESKTDRAIDTILIDKNTKFNNLSKKYRKSEIKLTDLKNNINKKIHSGKKIFDEIFAESQKEHLLVYINLTNNFYAKDEYIEQIMNQNWENLFNKITIIINKKIKIVKEINKRIKFYTFKLNKTEMQIFSQWYKKKENNFLITITGDGLYDLNKTMEHISLTRNLQCGMLIGSRNQNRSQHLDNIKKIYGKNIILYFFSKLSEFFFIIIYFLKLKFFLTDPNSGYRIYFKKNLKVKKIKFNHFYQSSLLKELVNNKVEVLEVPIKYNVKRNLSEKINRILNALKNIKGLYFD